MHTSNRSGIRCSGIEKFAMVMLVGLAMAAGLACENLTTGRGPQILVTPLSHTFPNIAVGNSDQLVVTIKNVGSSSLDVLSITMRAESSADFTISAPLGTPVALGPNQSVTFNVKYQPSGSGEALGWVQIRSSDSQSSLVTVELKTLRNAPDISVIPTVLDFGEVLRFGSAELIATIKNEGFSDLVVDGMSFDPSFTSEFTILSDTSFSLAPGAESQLKVRYSPQGCNSDEAKILIASNDPDESPFKVTVKGRPPGPSITVIPTRVAFPSVQVGNSDTKTVTVENNGSINLNVSSVYIGVGTSPAFSLQGLPAFPLVVPAAGSASFEVKFAPGTEGQHTGEMVLSSDDCDKPNLQIPLEGMSTVGPTALIQVTPTTLNFGNVASTLSATKTFNITSIGTLPLTVSTITITSGGSQFSVAAGDGGPFTLQPQATRDITIKYTPPSPGAHTGVVRVASNASNFANVDVNLMGSGAGAPTCRLTFEPSGILNFRDVAQGGNKTMPVVITNMGTGNCQYDKSELGILTRVHYSISSEPTLGTIIGPGTSRTVEVKFTPRTLGTHAGTLFINYTDPYTSNQTPKTIIITGRSVIQDIDILPAALDFGLTTLGCASQTMSVKVFNIGSADLNITAIALTAGSPRFQILQHPPLPAVVGGGTSIDIMLRYVPDSIGPHTGNLRITSDDPNEPTVDVPLAGTGTTDFHQIDVFEQSARPEVDILFVIDHSASMCNEQSLLASNFANFIQFADTLQADYQIGVVHVDINANDAGQLVSLNGSPKIITRNGNQIRDFNNNANIGCNYGGAQEAGLEGAKMALTDPNLTGTNAGFLRDDASLEIIAVSDEDDQSPSTIDYYVTFFWNVKGFANTNLFRFSAIVGDSPNGCTGPDSVEAVAGRRYIEVAQRTNGIIGSVCNTSFASTLQSIGNRAFGLRVQFFLSRAPDPSTITVKVDGVLNSNWTYDANSNSIIFSPSAVPPRGAQIVVEYDAICVAP